MTNAAARTGDTDHFLGDVLWLRGEHCPENAHDKVE